MKQVFYNLRTMEPINTENGVWDDHKPQATQLFNSYNVSSTNYVYNENGDTDNNAGWVDVKGVSNKVLQIGITLDGATASIDIRIEGKLHENAAPAEIYYKSYSASLSIDELMPIVEHPLVEVRLGVKITGSAGPANAITAYLSGDFSN